MTAEEIRDEHIMDTFINKPQNAQVRQRFLENRLLNLRMAYEQAYTFEVAQEQFVFYIQSGIISAASNTYSSFSPHSSYAPTSTDSSSVPFLPNQESPSILLGILGDS